MVVALFGPTGVGKSELAHDVARALGAEIVVADPFQRYRGLEIAADSPSAGQREEVTYHFVGDLALTEPSSAGDYARRAHAVIDALVARDQPVVVSGGTGLYLRAALVDLGFPAVVPADVHAAAESRTAADLQGAVTELRALAPALAEGLDTANPRRVARALELALAGVRSRPSGRLWSGEMRHPTVLVGLSRPREVLDALIARRVRRELDDGLVAELKAALDTPDLSRTAAGIIGLREVEAIRRGDLAPERLPEALTVRTRRLARAQRAWMRKLPITTDLDLGDRPAGAVLDPLLARIGARPPAAASDR